MLVLKIDQLYVPGGVSPEKQPRVIQKFPPGQSPLGEASMLPCHVPSASWYSSVPLPEKSPDIVALSVRGTPVSLQHGVATRSELLLEPDGLLDIELDEGTIDESDDELDSGPELLEGKLDDDDDNAIDEDDEEEGQVSVGETRTLSLDTWQRPITTLLRSVMSSSYRAGSLVISKYLYAICTMPRPICCWS
jgi:hypothetical protein